MVSDPFGMLSQTKSSSDTTIERTAKMAIALATPPMVTVTV
jgi:hypothetical protein